MKPSCYVLFTAFPLLLLGGCQPQSTLSVTGGEPTHYVCEQGAKLEVRYFSLSDKSLDFVKITLPTGTQYTLPQAVSASGARFTDDHQLIWWSKGNGGFVEQRDDDGEWQITYQECLSQ